MTLGEKIHALRLDRGMTLEQVGDIVGVGKSTVRKWESGQIANMRRDKIALLAKALGVTPSYLMGWEDRTESGGLPFGKSIDGLIPRSKISTRRVPILGDTAAGEPIITNRVYDEWVDIPEDGHHYDAVLRVTGDSMTPKYHKGDLVFIKYQEDVTDGQIAVVCVDGTATLKRVYHTQARLPH